MAQAEAQSTDLISILLVDDNPDNRVALRDILSGPDRRLVEVASGPEALRRLLDDEFAVLLVDVVMPGMNGFELASAIKGRERTATVPIIFLTGQANEIDEVYKGYQAGAVDYLVKPLIPEMVRAKVAVFVDLYRQRRQLEYQAALLVEAGRRESDLRLAELRLASERRFRALAEAIPQIVWTARPDGQVDYFNRRWFEYTGLSQEETQGSWRGAIHPDDRSRCGEDWDEARRCEDMFQVECRLLRSEGTYRWHLGRAVPERSPAGRVVAWLGTFTDIEEQKRSEAALAEIKGSLDVVLDAVFIFDPDDWRFLYVNQGASVLLGYSREELGRMRPVDVLVEHDADAFRELLGPLCDGSKVVITIETHMRRRDVRIVPVEVSMQFIKIDGGRIVSIARDITERRRAQAERDLLYREAVEAIRTRDEFLSVASHELRSPIAALQLQMEMLVRAGRGDVEAAMPPEKVKAKVNLMAKQIDRLTRLIGELMDVSRINAGRLRLEIEEADLTAIVREVVGRYDEEIARAGASVQLNEGGPVVGRWDRMRLEQVVTNLLTNALKFAPGKPIEIWVEAHGARAGLTVADHGIGISAEDVERIFQRFEQATTSSRSSGGLGLGLYIVRQIVEAHGGTVRVESQPGAGSTFYVDLPREPAPATMEGPATQAADGQAIETRH